MAKATIVLGLRARTGAAEVIAIARGPRFVARARLVLASAGAEYCYHEAAEMTLARAERHLRAAMADATARAVNGIRAIVDEAGEVTRAGLVRGKGRVLPPLEKIMPVHALWHAAEGEHYRDALEAACVELGIAVLGVPAPELTAPAGDLAALGRAAGKPWTVEQKACAMAALAALSASKRS